MTLAPAIAFGPWLLGEVLGLGGFAEVRRATPVVGGDAVALKRLLPMLVDSPAARAAFEAERVALALVRDRHVVQLLQTGETRRLCWLALGLVDGVSLWQLLRSGPLAQGPAAAALHDAALGLVACHAVDVLHGDLAPGNVLIDRLGTARLSDFGLAASPGGPDRVGGAGTPAFLDPEAASGRRRSPQSDVFGLALLWVRTRVGTSPLGAGPAADQRRRAAVGDLDLGLVAAAIADLPQAAADCVVAALRSRSSPPSAATFAAALAPVARRDALATLVLRAPSARVTTLDAAEERGEQVTDPRGETVTRVGLRTTSR